MREKFVGVGQMREKKFVWGRGQIQSPPHSDPPGGGIRLRPHAKPKSKRKYDVISRLQGQTSTLTHRLCPKGTKT
jgi:hypothetical protein